MHNTAVTGLQIARMHRDRAEQSRLQPTSKDSETIMSFLRPAVGVWLVAAAGAYGIGAAWAGNGQAGQLAPWVLVAMFWSAALLSVLVHYLVRYLVQAAGWTRRSWLQHAPARARLLKGARFGLAQASVWARRSWHRRATEGVML